MNQPQVQMLSPVQALVGRLRYRMAQEKLCLLKEMYLNLFQNDVGRRFLVLRHPPTHQHEAVAQDFLPCVVAFAWKSAQVHGFAYAPSSRVGEPVACRLLNTQMIRDFERQVARAFPSIATDQRAWASYKVLLEISEQMLCPRFLDQITSQQTHYFRQVNSDLVLRHLEQLLTYTGTPSPGLGPD